VETMVELREQARDELEAALAEREHAQETFEAAIGTSSEMRAYERLRRATRRVARADRQSAAPATPARSTIA
jgi:hypothetical protein